MFSCGEKVCVVARGIRVTDGMWHHVVLQADDEQIRVWLDGIEAGNAQILGLNIQAEYTNLVIGADTQGLNGFKGQIRDVSVYDTVMEPLSVWKA